MDLLDPRVMLSLLVGAGWLRNLKFKILYPEMAALKIPLLVLLEDLASFVDGSLDFPQEDCPLNNESCLGEKINCRVVDLGLVDLNCGFKTALASLKIGPRRNCLNVARHAV